MISWRHGATSWLGVLAALDQKLMHHFVQQRVVIGNKGVVILGDVERDGPAARVGIAVRAEGEPLTERHGVGGHQRNRLERAIEIAGVEFAPFADNAQAERTPGLARKQAHVLNGEASL